MGRAVWAVVIVAYAGHGTAVAQVVADFTVDRTIVAIPDPVHFTSTSTFPPDPNATYFWDFGDGEFGSGPGQSHIYEEPGVYSVTLAVHAAGEVDSVTKNSLVNAVIVNADFVAENNYVATGVPVVFSNLSDASGFPAAYRWDFGDGHTATDLHATHIYDTPGIYTVSLTVTTSFATRTKTRTGYLRVRPIEGCATAHDGGTFYLTVPAHFSHEARVDISLSSDYFTIARLSDASASLDAKYFVDPGDIHTEDLRRTPIIAVNDDWSSQSIRVKADHPLRLQGAVVGPAESDGFDVLPLGALGTEYRVVALPSVKPFRDASQFAIVGTEPATSVTIRPTVTVGSRTAGEPYTIELFEYRSYRLAAEEPGEDLTGTHITSNKPIAVFAGNRSTAVPLNAESELSVDYLVEQMLPFDALDRNHIAVPSSLRQNNMVRIVSSRADTQVTITGGLTQTFMLGEGKARNFIFRDPIQIQSTKPISVMQYALSAELQEESTGDAFMMTVMPTSRFLSAYTLQTPLDYREREFDSYLTIIVDVQDVESGHIYLDGSPISPQSFAPTPDPNYSYARIPVDHGVHYVDSARPFGAYLYGYGVEYESYGYPGGCNYCATATRTSPNADADLLREEYDTIDTNADGTIQLGEATAAGLTGEQFAALDMNGDGVVTLEEILAQTIGDVGSMSPVYVDFSAAPFGIGTLELPFNSLREAVAYVQLGGTVKVQSGSSIEAFSTPGNLAKPLRLDLLSGTSARIGESP